LTVESGQLDIYSILVEQGADADATVKNMSYISLNKFKTNIYILQDENEKGAIDLTAQQIHSYVVWLLITQDKITKDQPGLIFSVNKVNIRA